MDELLRDLSHGVRLLVRRPGFSAVAILSLALGIGLNTTLFSVVNAVLYRATPVADPDRLVEITRAPAPTSALTSSYLDHLSILKGRDLLREWRPRPRSAHLSTGGKLVLTTGEAVTANFRCLRHPLPRWPRLLPRRTSQRPAPGADGHGLWQRRFGGRDILGRRCS
jgi:hypothetical protein